MGFLRQLLSNPLIRRFLSNKVFVFMLFFFMAVALLTLIYRQIKKIKRKKRKKKAEGAKEEEAATPTIKSSHLIKIWTDFRRQIPTEFRRSILLYQSCIVFGEAESGKSEIIDKYTDWQGQACRFYPSYTAKEDLQIYLGSQVLVQEIPAPLLNDTSKQARNALIKLWKKFLHKRQPIVIITVNAAKFGSITPQELRRQAQLIRGKINIISATLKKPAQVRIVLTHMDQIEGFSEFSKFLRDNKIPLQINLDERNIAPEELKYCLSPYEKYLPMALTTLDAEKYKALITFLGKIPETFNSLSVYLQTLVEHDPLSYSVDLGKLYFTSNAEEEELANPFSFSWPKDILPRIRKMLFKHRLAAMILLFLGLFYLISTYQYEQGKWQTTSIALENFRTTPSRKKERSAASTIEKLKKYDEVNLADYVTPGFYTQSREDHFWRIFSRDVRDYYLKPLFYQYENTPGLHEEALYVLSLLYASKDNELGKMINDRVNEWANKLPLSEELIKTYIKYSNGWDDYSILEKIEPLRRKFALPHNLLPWRQYFRKIRYSFQQPYLQKSLLRQLRKNAKFVLNDIQQIKRYRLAHSIFGLLAKEAPRFKHQMKFAAFSGELKIGEGFRNKAEFYQQLYDFLKLLQSTHVDNDEKNTYVIPPVNTMDLQGLIDELKTMLKVKDRLNISLLFTLGGEPFAFASKKWVQLTQHSRIRILTRRFVSHHRRNRGNLFFSSYRHYPSIVMNPNNNGDFMFVGTAVVNGRYTHAAYSNEIKPMFTLFPSFVKSLPISRKDRSYLENFVFEEAESYTEKYREAWENYYQSFSVKANNLGSLKIILTMMQLPSSPFNDFQENILENTNIAKTNTEDPHKLRYLSLLRNKLKDFQPIHRLIQSSKQKGKAKKEFPEAGKYQAILRQMCKDLEGGKKKKKKKKKKGDKSSPELFEETLTPLGRISFGIFLERKDSYLQTTETWLKSIGITGKWQKPFLSPVFETYRLGMQDLETTIHKNWRLKILPHVNPILNKFPFNYNSKRDVTSLALEAALHPVDGTFVATFTNYIAPVCVNINGTWTQRTPPYGGHLEFPENMFKISNHLLLLSKLLWDKDGNQQKLIILVKPHELPKELNRKKYVTRAYLSCGKSSVFAFNQQPVWQKFEIEWWKAQDSKVGIQLTDPDSGEQAYQEIIVRESMWSFYKLLKRARLLRRNVWTWNVPENFLYYILKKVKFTIQRNPWKLFYIEGLSKKPVYTGE